MDNQKVLEVIKEAIDETKIKIIDLEQYLFSNCPENYLDFAVKYEDGTLTESDYTEEIKWYNGQQNELCGLLDFLTRLEMDYEQYLHPEEFI